LEIPFKLSINENIKYTQNNIDPPPPPPPSILSSKEILELYNFSQGYFGNMLGIISDTYGFKNKIVAEIGSDEFLECSRAAILLGARQVIAASYWPSQSPIVSEERLILKKLNFEEMHLPDNTFDLIFGMALLEHVLNPVLVASEIARMLKKGGHAFLQGAPMWTSILGHHVWVDCNNRKYHFPDSDVIDNWYHLTDFTKDDFKRVMLRKAVPLEDIPFLYDWVAHDTNISRIPPSKIVDIFKNTKGISVEVKISYDNSLANNYYDIAKKTYTEEDLRTIGLELYITKE
jgi:SAM-dependent methyltransferase